MRLLHPKTLEIAAHRSDIPKTVTAHCWAEQYKFMASGQEHPKCFITNEYDLGVYIRYVYEMSLVKGCNFDKDKVQNYSNDFISGFESGDSIESVSNYFDDNYLFSDACSLYFKGINIFPDIFGDEWRKYVPVESYKEILRQITKHTKI